MTQPGVSKRERHILESIHGLRRQLEIAHAGITVCATALRFQNADRDADVARVLSHLVGDRLFEQIERLSALDL